MNRYEVRYWTFGGAYVDCTVSAYSVHVHSSGTICFYPDDNEDGASHIFPANSIVRRIHNDN